MDKPGKVAAGKIIKAFKLIDEAAAILSGMYGVPYNDARKSVLTALEQFEKKDGGEV